MIVLLEVKDMDEIKIEIITNEKPYSECIKCSRVSNKSVVGSSNKVENLYKVRLCGVSNTLCKDCLKLLQAEINKVIN